MNYAAPRPLDSPIPTTCWRRRSNHSCDFQLSYNGHLSSAVCTESHVFRPFSSGESGARTLVVQNLTLARTSLPDDLPPRAASFGRRTNMLFEHGDDETTRGAASSLEAVIASTSALAARTRDGVDKEAAVMFARLVRDLRDLQLEELAELFDRTEDPYVHRSPLLDEAKTANERHCIIYFTAL